MSRLIKATEDDFLKVRSFYHLLIDMMQDKEYKPGWEKGVYPTDDYLKESLKNGELWVYECEDEISAAMVINHHSNDGYKLVKWSVEAEDSSVLIIHILGVMPTFQGKGIAGAMVKKAIEVAEGKGQKTLRLDVLGGNIPAERLYIKHGFRYVDTVKMFYEDTGWTDFKLYEYIV